MLFAVYGRHIKPIEVSMRRLGKPAGKYTAFHQTYGAGFLWYF